jgi:hypothetical protein
MWWRVGDSQLTRGVLISIAVYVIWVGWFWLFRRHPYVAIAILGFLRGLLERR